MPTAYSILPDRFEDQRHKSFERGLAAAGYRVEHGAARGAPGELLITWTRQRGYKEEQCERFEREGGRVIIAEEPHLKGRFPPTGERFYSLSLGDHQKFWRSGGPERWRGFGIELRPWRLDPGPRAPIVVRDQRGIGSATMRSPDGWGERTAEQLRRQTGRPVVLRQHPKRAPTQPSLQTQLNGAWCLVTWASHDGAEALIAGVPVIWCAPHGFVRTACGLSLAQIGNPPMPDDRQAAFERLAWSQWRTSEIESGEAFRWLLGR